MEIKNLSGAVVFKDKDADTWEGYDFKMANLEGANLEGANLYKANLKEADLYKADLYKADLSKANLSGAILEEANLSEANLSGANLSGANLYKAILLLANLSGANLSKANLSNTNLDNPNEVLKKHFKFNRKGMIVYKVIGDTTFPPNSNWKIEESSMISEVCNWNRQDSCGCGVNFGTRDWVTKNYSHGNLWECLIPFKEMSGVVVPLNFEGKARCSNLVLIKEVS